MKKSLKLPFLKTTLSLLFFPLLLNAQLKKEESIPYLQKHISTLASDSFGGREPGTRGEQLAMDYISAEFKNIGLKPLGTNNYLQDFRFTRNLKAGSKCRLIIGNQELELNKDYYPLAYSANTGVKAKAAKTGYGITDVGMGYDDYKNTGPTKGCVFIIDASTPDKAGPHTKYGAMSDLRSRIDTAIAKGAVGIIFYSADSGFQSPGLNSRIRLSPCSIPVLYLNSSRIELLSRKDIEINMEAELIREETTAHNVLGYIDNGAPTSIVIGAHYDHLGLGGEESLYRGEPAIHNGADDNASGVAGLIELARYLKNKGPKSNNYLLMAFSGEEKGLLGSSYFTRNATLPLQSINYMLNIDMIGRLKTDDPVLLIHGTGTSDAWPVTMNYIKTNDFKVKTTASGIGPSDHTSFYLKDIPVLHFFSGTHNDYHKPSDDEALINYNGELSILNYIVELINRLDDKGKIAFVKTKEENNENTPRFKVTLGVVPDYGFEGQGMRIDGVTDGKPASKAGMLSGDIVKAIGDHSVLDMMSYMKALGQFNKGEKVPVTVLRGKEEMKIEVEF